ncbi:DUF485 domain-containing protein [Streptomyces iconiensis]|uniref:DUF485 domain-containing protein n=1 Tax=Streptomyces iconiensis TaxID=1384038 RepID=UPI003D2F55A8
MRLDDPWYDALASGRGEHREAARTTAADVPPQERHVRRRPASRDARGDVYLTVQRSAAFQQVRRRYRHFALPASAAFLTWYLAYVVLATSAPGLMARPVAGVLNVAMAACLAQFATTFLLTWAYVRHARLRRDRLALELRWETQDMTRAAGAARRNVPADALGGSVANGTGGGAVGGAVAGQAAGEEAAL